MTLADRAADIHRQVNNLLRSPAAICLPKHVILLVDQALQLIVDLTKRVIELEAKFNGPR